MKSRSSLALKATSNRDADFVLEPIFWSVLLPGLCAGVLVACGLLPRGLSGLRVWRRSVIALALGGAAAGSFLGSVGMPSWPPAQKWHAVFALVLAFIAIGILDAWPKRGDWASRALLGLGAGALTWWLLALPGQTPMAAASGVVVCVWLISMLDGQRASVAMPIGGWAAATAVSLLTLVTGSTSLALMAGAIAVVCGVLIVIGAVPGRVVSGGGAMLGGCLAVLALAAMAYDYGSVPTWSWMLAMAGFPLASLFEIGRLGQWEHISGTITRSLLLLAPPIVSVWMNFEQIRESLSA